MTTCPRQGITLAVSLQFSAILIIFPPRLPLFFATNLLACVYSIISLPSLNSRRLLPILRAYTSFTSNIQSHRENTCRWHRALIMIALTSARMARKSSTGKRMHVASSTLTLSLLPFSLSLSHSFSLFLSPVRRHLRRCRDLPENIGAPVMIHS